MKKENALIKRSWKGKWIEPEQEPAYREPELNFEQMVAAEKSGAASEDHLKCAKHLRRVIDLMGPEGDLPVKVTAYASAHGVYELYVNGKKADDRVLAPETTDYRVLIWYQEYDMTDLLGESSRASIDVLLGDGWWIGRLGMAGSSCNYGDRLGFIMDVELTYPDGSVTTIGSDEQFVSCDSFIRYSDLYIGEMQDGACPDAEWFFDGAKEEESALYDDLPDSIWTNCVTVGHPRGILAKQPIPGVQTVQEIPCSKFVKNPKGELVADFGQVMAGVVRICVDAEPGTEFTLEHGEVLDRDGNYYSNIKGLYKDQKDRFLCRGGEQEFTPRFTYHGFRYVKITGLQKKQIRSLTALCYGTPLEKLGSFETDHKCLNKLQKAIENSTISNMISIPTDCPQREKLGWTGDINIFTGTGAFLYDLRDFLKSWLLQVRLDQYKDGEIPVVVPDHPCQEKMQRGMSGGTNSSAAWSDCCVFMPLRLYQIYGDLSFLEDNFDTMERWMSYVEGQAKGDLWTGRFHFGDWLIPSLREEEDGVMKGIRATADIVGSCYYSLAARAMAEICRILDGAAQDGSLTTLTGRAGRKAFLKRAEHYEQLTDRINEAIVKAYVYADGRVGVHAGQAKDAGPDVWLEAAEEDLQLQGLYILILKTEAVKDPELKNLTLERLVSLIKESGYTLDCGFSSIGFLMDVLYEGGHKDVAYKLLFSKKAPSWLYMIKNGATTIWENWRAIKEDGTVTDSSYNHYAYGCIGEFMYRHIGGIESLAPGYSRVRIAPDMDCGIHECSCSRKLPAILPAGSSFSEPYNVSVGEETAPLERKIVCNWSLDESSGRKGKDKPSGTIHVELPEGVSGVLVIAGEEREIYAGVTDVRF